jgi:hypothetical protein
MALIIGANMLFAMNFSLSLLASLAFEVTLATVAIFALDGISALIIRRLTPEKWYAPPKNIFKVSKNERDFYTKIKIKSWKDKVPEWGGFTNFHKDKLESQTDPAYLERFLVESNYGVIIHLSNAILGFLIAFIPFCSSPSIWIPVFSVNFILSLMPAAILRYTSYTLLRLYERSRKKII